MPRHCSGGAENTLYVVRPGAFCVNTTLPTNFFDIQTLCTGSLAGSVGFSYYLEEIHFGDGNVGDAWLRPSDGRVLVQEAGSYVAWGRRAATSQVPRAVQSAGRAHHVLRPRGAPTRRRCIDISTTTASSLTFYFDHTKDVDVSVFDLPSECMAVRRTTMACGCVWPVLFVGTLLTFVRAYGLVQDSPARRAAELDAATQDRVMTAMANLKTVAL